MSAKLVLGILFFLVDLAVFVVGGCLLLIGIGLLGHGTGAGDIKVVISKIGEISGINGQLVVFLTGAAMILISLAYALKAYTAAAAEAAAAAHKVGRQILQDTIQFFNPL
jgi:hypothetical protein